MQNNFRYYPSINGVKNAAEYVEQLKYFRQREKTINENIVRLDIINERQRFEQLYNILCDVESEIKALNEWGL